MYNMTVGLRLSYVHWFKASIQLESSGVFRFPNTTTTFLSKPFWCFFFKLWLAGDLKRYI